MAKSKVLIDFLKAQQAKWGIETTVEMAGRIGVTPNTLGATYRGAAMRETMLAALAYHFRGEIGDAILDYLAHRHPVKRIRRYAKKPSDNHQKQANV